MIELFEIYFPVIGVEMNCLLVIAIGILTGMMAGMFGLGGGVVVVPFLTFFGVPMLNAIATSIHQMIAATLSALITYNKKGKVDYKLSAMLVCGGLFGIAAGYLIVNLLKDSANGASIISGCFITLLGSMFILTIRDVIKVVKGHSRVHGVPYILQALPFRIKCMSYDVEVSVLPFMLVGCIGGILMALLGVGGGFVMIPMLIYILHVGQPYVPGTIQLCMFCTSIISTFLYSLQLAHIDVILALFLIPSAAIGARLGARIGVSLSPTVYRLLLAGLLFVIMGMMSRKLWANTHIMQNELKLIPQHATKWGDTIVAFAQTHTSIYVIGLIFIAIVIGYISGNIKNAARQH